jgi:hypothetical protein
LVVELEEVAGLVVEVDLVGVWWWGKVLVDLVGVLVVNIVFSSTRISLCSYVIP